MCLSLFYWHFGCIISFLKYSMTNRLNLDIFVLFVDLWAFNFLLDFLTLTMSSSLFQLIRFGLIIVFNYPLESSSFRLIRIELINCAHSIIDHFWMNHHCIHWIALFLIHFVRISFHWIFLILFGRNLSYFIAMYRHRDNALIRLSQTLFEKMKILFHSSLLWMTIIG